jgi:hypothetical protein
MSGQKEKEYGMSVQAKKGQFVVDRVYKWQATIDGVMEFGMTKKEAVAKARARLKRRAEDEAMLDNFNWVGSRHHY